MGDGSDDEEEEDPQVELPDTPDCKALTAVLRLFDHARYGMQSYFFLLFFMGFFFYFLSCLTSTWLALPLPRLDFDLTGLDWTADLIRLDFTSLDFPSLHLTGHDFCLALSCLALALALPLPCPCPLPFALTCLVIAKRVLILSLPSFLILVFLFPFSVLRVLSAYKRLENKRTGVLTCRSGWGVDENIEKWEGVYLDTEDRVVALDVDGDPENRQAVLIGE